MYNKDLCSPSRLYYLEEISTLKVLVAFIVKQMLNMDPMIHLIWIPTYVCVHRHLILVQWISLLAPSIGLSFCQKLDICLIESPLPEGLPHRCLCTVDCLEGSYWSAGNSQSYLAVKPSVKSWLNLQFFFILKLSVRITVAPISLAQNIHRLLIDHDCSVFCSFFPR